MQGPWEAMQNTQTPSWVSGTRHARQPGVSPTSKDARVPLGRLLILTQRVHCTWEGEAEDEDEEDEEGEQVERAEGEAGRG